ncbi:MAG TPA: hypothetical protein VGM44_25310 [Polyangiaceae bacterium]|jgi:hypothetical protein
MVLTRFRVKSPRSCALFALFALGCGSSEPLDANSGGGGAGASGVGGSASTAGSSNAGSSNAGTAPSCAAPGYPSDSTEYGIQEVVATLNAPNGAPVPNLLVQVCGINVCFNGMTNASGKTQVAPDMSLAAPAFKYGDGLGYAKLAIPLSSEATQDLGTLVALPLPSYADGAAFPASGEVTSGDVTLILQSGGSVTHDLLTYTDASELTFRSVQIPLAQSTGALDPSFGFELGYALAPVSSVFCPAAGLRVKNTLGWAANSAVEVFVQGLEVDDKWAPYGNFVKVADAAVNADASAIEIASGGIPILSAIALRRKTQ